MHRPAATVARLVALTMLCAAALALPAGALAAPAATGKKVELNWVEKLTRDKQTKLELRFDTLSTSADGWTAEVSIVNTGTAPVAVGSSQFGVAEFDTKTNFSQPLRFLRATTLIPAPPRTLAPGKTWKGTIGGAGKPDEHLYVRIVLGPFTGVGSPQAFTWITDHARHVFAIRI